jgi:hypothetical protein
LVKSGNDVQLGVPFSLGDVPEDFRDLRKGIAVFDGDFIKCSVVNTKTDSSARLMCQQDGGSGCGVADSDELLV